MGRPWTVGRIFGVRLEITPSWLLIFGLMTYLLAAYWFPYTVGGLSTGVYLLLGVMASLMLFLSVLLHMRQQRLHPFAQGGVLGPEGNLLVSRHAPSLPGAANPS